MNEKYKPRSEPQYLISMVAYFLFGNKKFKEYLRKEIRETLSDILLNKKDEKIWREHYKGRSYLVDKEFQKKFERDLENYHKK